MWVCMFVESWRKRKKNKVPILSWLMSKRIIGRYNPFPHGLYNLKGIESWLKLIHFTHIYISFQLANLFPLTVYSFTQKCPLSPLSLPPIYQISTQVLFLQRNFPWLPWLSWSVLETLLTSFIFHIFSSYLYFNFPFVGWMFAN